MQFLFPLSFSSFCLFSFLALILFFGIVGKHENRFVGKLFFKVGRTLANLLKSLSKYYVNRRKKLFSYTSEKDCLENIFYVCYIQEHGLSLILDLYVFILFGPWWVLNIVSAIEKWWALVVVWLNFLNIIQMLLLFSSNCNNSFRYSAKMMWLTFFSIFDCTKLVKLYLKIEIMKKGEKI